MGEALGRDVLVNAAWLLANTRTLVIASGIANIFARDAMAMAAARVQLNEQSGGRFLLGMGISHAPIVSAILGHIYEKTSDDHAHLRRSNGACAVQLATTVRFDADGPRR